MKPKRAQIEDMSTLKFPVVPCVAQGCEHHVKVIFAQLILKRFLSVPFTGIKSLSNHFLKNFLPFRLTDV